VKIWQNMFVCGGAFATSIAFFCLGQLIGDRLGLVSDVIAIAGNATCGWSWLLARALFQSEKGRSAVWPVAIVFSLIAAGALLRLAGDTGPIMRMVGNIETLTSSTVLLLALIEPLRGFHPGMPKGEQGFRIAFVVGYAALLAVSVLWVNGSPAGGLAALWGDRIKMACALTGVVEAGLAIWYRHRRPLPDQGRTRRRPPASDDSELGARILRLMADDSVYTVADMKVADLARRVGEAEYKVTQCITGTLGFRNFNQMINHFRLAEAQARLADPACGLPVLTIALDCGFGSIGPFNRAFKAETGLTPTAFREAHRAAEAA